MTIPDRPHLVSTPKRFPSDPTGKFIYSSAIRLTLLAFTTTSALERVTPTKPIGTVGYPSVLVLIAYGLRPASLASSLQTAQFLSFDAHKHLTASMSHSYYVYRFSHLSVILVLISSRLQTPDYRLLLSPPASRLQPPACFPTASLAALLPSG